MCQATESASGDAVSREGALQSGEGAEAWPPSPHFHGDLLKRRAFECRSSELSNELMMAGGWVNHLNDALAAERADNTRLREALEAAQGVLSGLLGRGDESALALLRKVEAALSSAPRPDEEGQRPDTAAQLAKTEA